MARNQIHLSPLPTETGHGVLEIFTFIWVTQVELASLADHIFSRQHYKISVVLVNDKAS